ncbi:MAG: HTH domain-containing protein [Pirellulaceae bacterium]
MGNSYLELARQILRSAGRPLRPKEILEIALRDRLMPRHLHGATQYKTLHARLSEDIRRNSSQSHFLRVEPGVFFLREPIVGAGSKQSAVVEYLAPRRARQLKRANVLLIRKRALNGITGIVRDPDGLIAGLKPDDTIYDRRRAAESRTDAKQVVSYVVVFRDSQLLTYRRGKYSASSDELRGLRSIGFSAHVDEGDLDLFGNDPLGIQTAGLRELVEDLGLTHSETNYAHARRLPSLAAVLNMRGTVDCERHIAAICLYKASPYFQPTRRKLPIRDLRWMQMTVRVNDEQEFEPWSRYLLQQHHGQTMIERIIKDSPSAQL